MKELPEGTSLGWMQAPASWIDSHTVRFIGLVRVVIQDGEGYILIKKGKPLLHYFRHGTIELKGHTALDYFNSHPIIEFNLCRYTPEEFALALKLCNVEDPEPVVPKEPAVSKPVSGEHTLPSRPAGPPVANPVGNTGTTDPVVVPHTVHTVEKRAAVSTPVSGEHTPPSRPAGPPVANPVRNTGTTDPVIVPHTVHTVEKRAVVPQPGGIHDPDAILISQIRDLNKGIVAISVFNEKRTVIMLGDDGDSEVLLIIARKMLETAKKITPRLTWGPFVHMTIQIPAGNMIIAPYHENYLCMLTTRTINIGHIRRILRDLQQKGIAQCVS